MGACGTDTGAAAPAPWGRPSLVLPLETVTGFEPV